MLDGEFNQSRDVAEIELLHEATAIGLHGFGGKVEDIGDGRTGFSLCH